MALYAFDGTGDRWDPGTRWNLKDLRQLDKDSKQALLDTITPTAKTEKDRYLTNVVFFYKEYVLAGGHGEYFPGVGTGSWFETKTGKTLDFILGGAFGIGAQGVVKQAFNRLKRNFKAGDRTIDIVGYSRGAAIARLFADKTFKDYKKLTDEDETPLTAPPEIRFIGLFDTVASFGNPFNDNELFFQNIIPNTAQYAVHAMSLDLHRKGFGLDRAYGDNVLEVWFRGGHGDVGGNSIITDDKPNRERTNITLNFMLRKAKAAGLNLGEANYPTNVHAPIRIQDNALDQKGKDPSRQIRKHDVFHHSFFDADHQEISFNHVVDTPLERKRLVIEESWNETQWSEQRLLRLTPELAEKFPDTQSIYQLLQDC